VGALQENQSRAVCILGMHRSGTSTIARAVNLLGVYLGEEKDLGTANEDNPEGYWERPDVTRLHGRLLAEFGRNWDSTAPLPEDWSRSDKLVPYKAELKSLIIANFGQHSLWAWKDPRTCLFLPLWREVLDELGVKLLCVFAVRSPLDVANSLKRRDAMRLGKAFGLWFNYNISALQAIGGVPTAFLGYDSLIESWEPELRKCALILGISWPKDEQRLNEAMRAFIRPKLRHSQTGMEELEGAPHPIRELYGILIDNLDSKSRPTDGFNGTATNLCKDFHAYASFFEAGLDNPSIKQVSRPPYVQRTLWRWKRSIRKRLPGRKGK
jgi:hypothetical protein